MTKPIKSIADLPILMPVEIQNLNQISYLLTKLCQSRKSRSRTRGAAIRRFLLSLYKVEMLPLFLGLYVLYSNFAAAPNTFLMSGYHFENILHCGPLKITHYCSTANCGKPVGISHFSNFSALSSIRGDLKVFRYFFRNSTVTNSLMPLIMKGPGNDDKKMNLSIFGQYWNTPDLDGNFYENILLHPNPDVRSFFKLFISISQNKIPSH